MSATRLPHKVLRRGLAAFVAAAAGIAWAVQPPDYSARLTKEQILPRLNSATAEAGARASSAAAAFAPIKQAGADRLATAGGHPTLDAIDELSATFANLGTAGDLAPPFQDPPLTHGDYVNFESPPFRPLAFSPESRLLAAANTPNGSVVLFTVASGSGALTLLREVPVGLDPVHVAFQPNSSGRRLWVVNHISDDASVIDALTGQFLGRVELRDEPIAIVFDPTGAHAFIVSQSGYLQAVNAASLQVASTIALPANTPRAAVFDPVQNQVVVASLHSGNNTTVVGKTMRHVTLELGAPFLTLLFNAFAFSDTSAIFDSSPALSPWPDLNSQVSEPAPLVQRIVPDAGRPSAWADIVNVFSTDSGEPDPDMLDAYVQQLIDDFGITLVNAFQIIDSLIKESTDTLDHDLIRVDVSSPESMTIAGMLGGVGTTLTGLARNPVTGELLVSNLQARNEIRIEDNLRGHFIDHQVVWVSFEEPAPTITPRDLHAGIPDFNDVDSPNPAAQAASLANPLDLVVSSDGARAYVVALGASRVGVLDAATGAVLDRIDVGAGPRGLALDEADQSLFVLNRTDMTISVIALTPAPSVVSVTPLFNPEPMPIREGRDFLYGAARSNNGASACSLCHIDGNLDHLAWDLGQASAGLQPTPHIIADPDDPCAPAQSPINHPLKGPMVTLSLRGLDGHNPFHWRGDRPQFTDFAPAFDGLLGGSVLPDADMAKFDAFIRSVAYPPTPNRPRDNSLSASAAHGRELFEASCNACHQLAHDGAMRLACLNSDIAFDLSGLVGQIQEVPQLRNIHRKFQSDAYNGFGLLHNGTEKSEENGHPIQTFLLDFFGGFSAQDRLDMIAFLDAFPTNARPIVGWQLPIRAGGPGIPLPIGLQLMIDHHRESPPAADVVSRHFSDGRWHGYVLLDGVGPALFQQDDGAVASLSQLLGLASAQNPVLFMATPPGSGERIGVDQDRDGFLNALDFCPQYANNGDLNGDGVTSVGDIGGFVLILTDPTGYGAAFPGVNGLCAGDVNNSGAVTVGDIGPFVNLLTSGV